MVCIYNEKFWWTCIKKQSELYSLTTQYVKMEEEMGEGGEKKIK